MSEPQHSRMVFRGQAEANPAYSRAIDRPFHSWIRMALLCFAVGTALLVLNPPIAEPLGLIAASTLLALGLLAAIAASLARVVSESSQHGRARFALRLLGPIVWAGVAVALVTVVVGLIWP